MKLLKTTALTILRATARMQLAKNKPLVIGVTGSAGKTSTVSAIAQVLATKHRIKYTHKGNSETGIPFEILDIPVESYNGLDWLFVCLLAMSRIITHWPKYDLFVAEMGIDSDKSPKNMEYLLTILQPTIGVLLNVNAVHGQNFSGEDTLAAITNEKGKLLTSLPTNGLAVYSADHSQIMALKEKIVAEQKVFSITNKSADIQLVDHVVDTTGTKFIFEYQNKPHMLHFKNYYLFKEAFGTFAAALLIGKHFEVSIEEGVAVLESTYHLPPGRMSVIEGINDSTILDSSYNSSPEPTIAALKLLKTIPTSGKRIAVLGDMREIGKLEKESHEDVAEVARTSADTIVLVGPLMKKYAQPYLIDKGFDKEKLHSFTTAYEAIDTLKSIIDNNDLILVKGSQNTIFLEIVVKAIMKYPERATEILCRQSTYWEKQRQKLS